MKEERMMCLQSSIHLQIAVVKLQSSSLQQVHATKWKFRTFQGTVYRKKYLRAGLKNIPEFSDSAFLKKFNDLGLYVYSYEITHTAVEGRSKRYYINMIGNSITRNKANGASSILVIY